MAEKVNSGRSFLPPEFVVASPCLTESPVGLFLLESQRANPIHQPLNRRNARNKDDNCTDDQKRIHRAPLIVAQRSNLPGLRRHRKRDARDEDRGHFGWSSFFATGFLPVRMTIPLPPVGMIIPLGPGWRFLKAGLIQ